MAFNGWFIKIGEYVFPTELIAYDSLNIQYITQDLDSYTDADGVLHRTALAHKVPKVVFNTVPMDNAKYADLYEKLEEQFFETGSEHTEYENAFLGTVYIPYLDDYVSAEMYMAGSEYSIRSIENGKINYNAIRFAFIGY